MRCRYCGDEVPLRKRLTSEPGFCSDAHRRLYQEEHSRLGLVRLLEQHSPQPKQKAEVKAAPAIEEVEPVPELTAARAEEPVKLWTHPAFETPLQPLFREFLRLSFAPELYSPPDQDDWVEGAEPPQAEPLEEPRREGGEPPQGERHEEPPGPDTGALSGASEIQATAQSTIEIATVPTEPVAVEPSTVLPALAPRRSETTSEFETTSISAPTLTSKGMSLTTKLMLLGAVATVGGVLYFGVGQSNAPKPVMPAKTEDPGVLVRGGEWISNWAGGEDEEGRPHMAVFGPSMKWSDYRAEFQGEIERKSLSWFFRAADPNNYYAMRLEVVQPGTAPRISVVRYTVIDGQQMDRVETPLKMQVYSDTVYKVQLVVKGSNFRATLQGETLGDWTDSRLKTGGFGFLNENDERAKIHSAQIYFLGKGRSDGGTGRTQADLR